MGIPKDHLPTQERPSSARTISFFSVTDVSGLPVTEFGLDNLTFVAPEPASFFGLAGGLAGLGNDETPASGDRRG
jgi:hypothetical protein